ncbi:hypothetical protein OWR28_14495 [Chryseobacterium sp. 1B4]
MIFCINLNLAQTVITAKPADTKTKKETISGAKLKKDGTPDKRYSPKVFTMSNGDNIKLKKDGTPDKRYSTAKEQTVAVPAQNQSVNKPGTSNINDKKRYIPALDRTLRGPNGEEVLTGPRGGKYYINKNGNKTYIKR